MAFTKQQALQEIRRLVKLYNEKTEDYLGKPNELKALYSEEDVVHHYIRPLLTALNWPTQDPDRFKYEKHTVAGRPDLMLIIPELGNSKIYTEAKKLTVIADLAASRTTIKGVVTPGQLALPGMAVDRSREEQQAINYAFANGGQWAILTNFEKLRVFNARRDWLVFSFETPNAYLDEFDDLWELSYGRILEGSLDALSNQRYREDVDQNYLAFINEWREKLAQNIIDNIDKNEWAVRLNGEVDLDLLRSVVQRVLDRLVVVRFAEDHYVIPPATLEGTIERSKNPYYGDPIGVDIKKLFRNFNERHNSALFAPDYADEATFDDAVLESLIERLYEARYRAMTPDIMGNTYEQYLGKTLTKLNSTIKTTDNLETRKKQGSYYTPQVIVRYLVDQSLGRYLGVTPSTAGSQSVSLSGNQGTATAKESTDYTDFADGKKVGERRKMYEDIAELRVLDPACGSGSFLIYAYEVLADFYRSEIRRLEMELDEFTSEQAKQGATPLELQMATKGYTAQIAKLLDYPRIIVEKHLYGVDLDPQAAEIATVNLIMRAMSDLKLEKQRWEYTTQSRQNELLPLILNQNVKVGNSLIGAGPNDPRYGEGEIPELLARLRELRLDLAQTDHNSAGGLRDALAKTSHVVRTMLNEPLKPYFEDVEARRPFHWAVEFPEVFVDENGRHKGEAAGFTVIVGNPPWEIVKPDLREFYAQFDPNIESHYTREQAEKRIAELEKEDPTRLMLWKLQTKRIEENANYFRSGNQYVEQGRGDTALHKLFLERAYSALSQFGRLAFVLPAGIYKDLGTQELRRMVLASGSFDYIYGFSNVRWFFPGVNDRVQFAMIGVEKGASQEGFWATFRFNPRVAVGPDNLAEFLANSENLIFIRYETLAKLSPDSFSVLEFQSKRDYQVVERLYENQRLVGEDLGENIWRVHLNREFDISNDREMFNQVKQGIPLYEGKMIHQFDAFFSQPSYWMTQEKLQALPIEKQKQLTTYRVTHRRITRPTDERTLISAIVPRHTCCENNATTALIEGNDSENIKLYVCALLNSLVLDYIIRYRITATLNMFYLYQLPMPRLTQGNPYFDAIVPLAAQLTCTRSEFAGLWEEVMGTRWDESCGVTDPAARQRLRDEIDALVAHLYGLSREDFEHILGTFPLVFPDTAEGQEKKAALLGVYDAFAGVVEGWGRE